MSPFLMVVCPKMVVGEFVKTGDIIEAIMKQDCIKAMVNYLKYVIEQDLS